jgi:hypothetical protein
MIDRARPKFRRSHYLLAAFLATALGVFAPAKAQIGQPQQVMPDAYKLSMLVRTTLIALSQANQTGNYSVLRDLGTPQFQALNSDAQLAQIFSGLRARNLDFSPVLYFDPQLQRPPAFEGSILRLTGLIPTKPQRIVFDMGFEQVVADWRLSAIVIDVQQSPPDSASQPSSKGTENAAGGTAKTKPSKKLNVEKPNG